MSYGQGPSSWPRRHTMRTHYPALAIAKAAVCGGPGPGATLGPTRSAWALASSRAHTRCGVAALAPVGGLFAHSASGAWPAAAAPCVPRPRRRGGPALRASLRASPRCLRSARVRAVALRGRSLGPSAFGPGLPSLRASCPVALAAGGLGPCAARARRGGACAPFGARVALAPAPPPCGPCGPLFGARGRGVFSCAPCACARLAASGGGCSWAALLGFRCAAPRRAAAVVVVTFSPRRPPVRRPPPGALVGAQG